MIGSFLNIFKVPELRRKVTFTLLMLLVYRVGVHIPTPFIDSTRLKEFFRMFAGDGQGVFAVVDMFSGGAFSQMTIFALGIMPYISASIILQLLTVVWPRLEKISKEGEAGRKKINQWTRYFTVILSLFQGVGIGVYLHREGLSAIPGHPIVFLFTTSMTMAAGTCFLMWLGEKITEHGIGNGISLIIAVGILAMYPMDFALGWSQAANQAMSWLAFIGVMVSMVLTSALIVLMQESNRKIPVQHARRMVGRKVMQGGSTFLPLKINTAGVIPVIFSSAIMSFPTFFVAALPGTLGPTVGDWLSPASSANLYNLFNLEAGGIFNVLKVINFYTIAFAILTAFFCFFYTALTFNPVDLADNLKKSGAFIPGQKPGKPTSDFINYTLVRITVVGSIFLVGVSLVPNVLSVSFDIPFNFAHMAGGTGLIIVIGVILDTMKQIESQLLMRHYEGFSARGAAGGTARRARRY
jgi:preprotein translocase subunit SecY